MANQNDKNLKDLINSDEQSSKALRGTDSSLDLEDVELRDLIRQTTNRSTLKYSSKVEGERADTAHETTDGSFYILCCHIYLYHFGHPYAWIHF